MDTDPEPSLLSIITVVYNGADTLEATILSIVNNKPDWLEYIVIDGGSQDGTLDLVQQYNDQIDIWISDRDNGLYDAMNKGTDAATGKYLWFINSGDLISDNIVYTRIYEMLSRDPDIVCGEVNIVNASGEILGTRSNLTVQQLPDKLTSERFRRGMTVCHQGFIVKKSIAPKYEMDNWVADYDWMIKCVKLAKSYEMTHVPIVNFLGGGISKRKWRESMVDRLLTMKKHYGLWPTFKEHIFIGLRYLSWRLRPRNERY